MERFKPKEIKQRVQANAENIIAASLVVAAIGVGIFEDKARHSQDVPIFIKQANAWIDEHNIQADQRKANETFSVEECQRWVNDPNFGALIVFSGNGPVSGILEEAMIEQKDAECSSLLGIPNPHKK